MTMRLFISSGSYYFSETKTMDCNSFKGNFYSEHTIVVVVHKMYITGCCGSEYISSQMASNCDKKKNVVHSRVCHTDRHTET